MKAYKLLARPVAYLVMAKELESTESRMNGA
jgi:hypothetical protein